MSADLDLAESTIFPAVTMISAGINGAFDTVIFVTFIHDNLLFVN